MESSTLQTINEILKEAPENILEKVLEYIEEIIKDENNNFKISTEQTENIKRIEESSYAEQTDIEVFLNGLNGKSGL